MVKCDYCERELKENESFYVIQDRIYCFDCVEEETRTYYKIGDDPEDVYADSVVGEYENIKDYAQKIKNSITFYSDRVKEYEKIEKKENWIQLAVVINSRKVEELKKILARLENDGKRID